MRNDGIVRIAIAACAFVLVLHSDGVHMGDAMSDTTTAASAVSNGSSQSSPQSGARRAIEFPADVHITELTEWRDADYKIHGNVVFDPGGTLILDRATVELMNTYARQFNYKWNGGTLISRDATLGGTADNGPADFELYDGNWYSTDTTIRYCYGIIFGSGDQGGKLRAVRIRAGTKPDTVIMTGKGDAVIKDSNYMISLFTYAGKESRQCILDLPLGTPMNCTFDGSFVPGAEYRLELINTSVPFWFLFVNNLAMDGPPIEITLRDCPGLNPGMVGGNLKGVVTLPSPTIEPYSIVTLGNVTWKTLDKPCLVPAWSVYLYGDETDLTIKGPTTLAELMLYQGKLSVIGTDGTFDAKATATTIDVGRVPFGKTAETPGNPRYEAHLLLRNASVGWFNFSTAVSYTGQISAHDRGEIRVEHSQRDELVLITKGNGTISMCDVQGRPPARTIQEGGPIRFADMCP